MKRIAWSVLVLVVLAALMVGCSQGGQTKEETTAAKAGAEYTQIPQELAKEMMRADDSLVVVDVRTQEEYAQGHIPGAICIPNEGIVDAQPEELLDLEQTILVYCRSGRRSKEAAQKLADMGYTNVYEFGGIIDWNGEVVTE